MMNEIVRFQEPRLPYHEKLLERFNVDRGGWKVLTEAVFPSAKTQDAVVMALSYCHARKLDIFKKPVHIVPMWSSLKGAMVETVWPAISELRTTAFRTGQYIGLDATEFGPLIEQNFKGQTRGKDKEDLNVTIKFPEWARCTVHRTLDGIPRTFVGPKVYWVEEFARIGGTEVPNAMWQKRPNGQLEKCSEAGALRRAFPEEIGNEYSAEEMEGKSISNEIPALTAPSPPTTAPSPPPAPPAQLQPKQINAVAIVEHEQQAAEGMPYPDRIADWEQRLKASTPVIQAEIFDIEIDPFHQSGAMDAGDHNRLMAMVEQA